MDYHLLYQEWLADETLEEELQAELRAIADNETEIKERFCAPLAFGTGGMRGIMGAGINRMNRPMIEQATAGLASYLLNQYQRLAQQKGVVIAYDSRRHSQEFAQAAALVLASYGVKAYVFRTLMPTPVLSFAVAHLGAVAGIVITASHNPKEYNGYKVYDRYGCQLTLDAAAALTEFVARFADRDALPILMSAEQAEKEGLLLWLDDTVLAQFEEAVLTQSLLRDEQAKAALKVVYTPLHGAGLKPVTDVLAKAGFTEVTVLPAQAEPDGDFSTVRSPNPEDEAALALAIDYARAIGADLVLGTDPDCDRVGIAVREAEGYRLLSGNQVGALLTDFVLSQKADGLNEKSTLIKTIVTSDLGAAIARSYGVQVLETLTGFKFIGEQMTRFEQQHNGEFVLGYEESYGYLVGTHARDKDAVVASLLIAEMTAYHKSQGRTLIAALDNLYARYGYYLDKVDSFTLSGLDGAEKIRQIMAYMRAGGQKLLAAATMKDYALGLDNLPPSDVLKYGFAPSGWLAVRPSGTEPKIKFYYGLVGQDQDEAQRQLADLRQRIASVVAAIAEGKEPVLCD